MLSSSQIATLNLEEARRLRLGTFLPPNRPPTHPQRRSTGLDPSCVEAKAAATRLRSKVPGAADRDLPVGQSVLPLGFRKNLIAAGYHTLGDLADLLSD